MQNDAPLPARVLANFLRASRRYFDLPSGPNALGVSHRLRPILRSLVIIGSLGSALAQPALAADSVRLPDERKATGNTPRPDTTPTAAPSAAAGPKSTSQH